MIFWYAIVQVSDHPFLCLSPCFVIPNSTGNLRVILNFKAFDVFIPVQHFRFETLNVILPQLTRDVWAVTLVLKDTYLRVPVRPDSRSLLGFSFLGRTFLFQVLPFGL